ncbi:hypothetical protein LX15_002322 [Streptoalloteichus tenebrarius]|uniref:Cytochrome P450 n=2 Tax=Streptoalloteichus tenebrarius (strain ATCC 17920 / DSM 40477 / JCM 4838 / CBS 697.72 / NBRC 16177 / NCIMB 11028 / NRRL B-12390 / A12253. 1 / ISP 5477) TaxID=1933 RepID=A0ABT1HSY4_STRSD|nr:hypothetical protein [Streptoalloteichus tenebrarius]
MRGAAHVCQDPRTGIWQVFRYQDVRQVMADTATFSSEVTRVVPDSHTSARGNVMLTDPPEHGRLRTLVSQASPNRPGQPKDVAALRWNSLTSRIREPVEWIAGGGAWEIFQAVCSVVANRLRFSPMTVGGPPPGPTHRRYEDEQGAEEDG